MKLLRGILDKVGTNFEKGGKPFSPDFKKIAEAFGCHAERATKAEQIRPALKRALKSGKPAVVHVGDQPDSVPLDLVHPLLA